MLTPDVTVLLIDEADVFLERRSLHDMQRNAMVSVFLRVLECKSTLLTTFLPHRASFEKHFQDVSD